MQKKFKKLLAGCLVLCLIITQTLLNSIAFAETNQTKRLFGDDRYKTAVAISQDGWASGSDYAVLARGDDFADALCAVPLAKKYNAPILLTQTDRLNADTLAELKRLNVKQVFIVGGTGAVSADVESALTSAGIGKVIRVWGQDRYGTSIEIAKFLGAVDKVVIATGMDFPDALSIAPIAAVTGMPILLTEKDKLPDDVKNYIDSMMITQSYIIGGTGVISDAVKNIVPGAKRLGGPDRYSTNLAVMQEFADTLDFSKVFVAVGDGLYGDEFADALTGAAYAAKTNSPVILAYKTLAQPIADFLKTKLLQSSVIFALGGEAVVPAAVATAVAECITQQPAAGGGGGGPVSTPAVSAVNDINKTTVEVIFSPGPGSTTASDYVFVAAGNPEITASTAAYKNGDNTKVILTIAGRVSGVEYTLKYKGALLAGKTIKMTFIDNLPVGVTATVDPGKTEITIAGGQTVVLTIPAGGAKVKPKALDPAILAKMPANSVHIDLEVTDAAGNKLPPIPVTLPIPTGVSPSDVGAVHYDEDNGRWEVKKITNIANGYVTFETQFSPAALIELPTVSGGLTVTDPVNGGPAKLEVKGDMVNPDYKYDVYRNDEMIKHALASTTYDDNTYSNGVNRYFVVAYDTTTGMPVKRTPEVTKTFNRTDDLDTWIDKMIWVVDVFMGSRIDTTLTSEGYDIIVNSATMKNKPVDELYATLIDKIKSGSITYDRFEILNEMVEDVNIDNMTFNGYIADKLTQKGASSVAIDYFENPSAATFNALADRLKTNYDDYTKLKEALKDLSFLSGGKKIPVMSYKGISLTKILIDSDFNHSGILGQLVAGNTYTAAEIKAMLGVAGIPSGDITFNDISNKYIGYEFSDGSIYWFHIQ